MKHCWIAALAVGLLVGCSSTSSPTSPPSSTASDNGQSSATPAPGGAAAAAAPAISAATDQPVYASVQKIFTASCAKCHGPAGGRVAGNLSLTTYAEVMKGGKSGPCVVAGDANSLLIQYITGAKQPQMPRKAPPLAQQDIDLIKNWIAAGAKGA
jgi:mono/diheme cytochrome c family protein